MVDKASFESLRTMPLARIRETIRNGSYRGHTAGLAPGHLQGNLAILPAAEALDFFRFCQRNPKPCPLIGVSDTGDPKLFMLGRDIDVRTDVPEYRIYRHGELCDEVTDIKDFWQADHVAFVLGCSFTFEQALIDAGIRLRHIEDDLTVSMYQTTIATTPAGPFGGGMVVSMRPIRRDQVDLAVEISATFPQAHGTPVHIGDPSAIGIKDLSAPQWGDAVTINDNEIPVFWACGVTPQNAIRVARPLMCITHAPGRMLITDIVPGRNEDAQSTRKTA